MKVLNVIRSVLAWIMVVIAVCMMIFTVVSVLTFDRVDRNLFGYKAFIVLSDSMSKTDFDAGDLVLVKEVDPSTLKEGDIIAYSSQNEENYGATVTHKIRRLTTDANGNPGFVTYGTTTDTDDETVVTYPFVLGKYQKHKPGKHFFYGSSASDLPFCNAAGGKAGYNDIRIIGCELSKYYQPICWNNKASVLNGFTANNNTFTGCFNNHIQITNKINRGRFVLNNNKLVNMVGGSLIRMANVQSDVAITISGTVLEGNNTYSQYSRVAQIEGESGFTVDASNNQWSKDFFLFDQTVDPPVYLPIWVARA